jgi:hypothetical protein
MNLKSKLSIEHLKIKNLKIKKNMKHSIKAIPIISAAAFCAAVLAGPNAKADAVPINGSIAFGAAGVVVNNPTLADATSFYVDGPVVLGGPSVENTAYVGEIPQGSYSSVPLDTLVTFTSFTFTSPAAVMPLWTFTQDGLTYSFDATSVAADWNASRDEWDIGGNGIAMISGFTPTAGTWTVNLSQTGSSFAFDATSGAASSPVTAAAVPDGGSSMFLLGSACLGLGAFSRKYRR